VIEKMKPNTQITMILLIEMINVEQCYYMQERQLINGMDRSVWRM